MDEVKITGIEFVEFTGQDGKLVKGINVHGTMAISSSRGVGRSAQRFFLSQTKLDGLSFKPQPGQIITVLYSRYGKPQTLNLVSDVEEMIEIE